MRLLEADLIDGDLRPVTRDGANGGPSPESQRLIKDGLEAMLGDDFAKYADVTGDARRELLMQTLRERSSTEEAS